MRIVTAATLYFCFASAAWAAGATTRTPAQGNGETTVTSPNAGEIGILYGPYGYQPAIPNTPGFIGPVEPAGPVENTPINTGPAAIPGNQASSAAAINTEAVYGNCYSDPQGHSVHALISWECHAADGTVISAGQCQTPAAVSPCN